MVVKDWGNAGASASTLSVEPLRPSAKKRCGRQLFVLGSGNLNKNIAGFSHLKFWLRDNLNNLKKEQLNISAIYRKQGRKYFNVVIFFLETFITVCCCISPKLFSPGRFDFKLFWDISPKLFSSSHFELKLMPNYLPKLYFQGQCDFKLMLSYFSQIHFDFKLILSSLQSRFFQVILNSKWFLSSLQSCFLHFT